MRRVVLALAASMSCYASLVPAAISAEPAKSKASQASPLRPNVLFILADDLGYSDTTLYGTTTFFETPNIQRLADRGVVLSNAYAASPVCSPTRASILTGQEPGRLGITAAKTGKRPPVSRSRFRQLDAESSRQQSRWGSKKAMVAISATVLPSEISTLAETLRSSGYVTGHFGKWHLGSEPHSPLEHGFDVDLPHLDRAGLAGAYIAPWGFSEETNFEARVPSEHIEDRMASEAVAFMAKHRNEPFFLNYWAFSVHGPPEAKPELVEKYVAKASSGRHHGSPVYAAMIQSFDEAVGKLLDGLDRLGLSERTIVVFYSDNGGSSYIQSKGLPLTSNSPLRGGKAQIYEGGIRVPAFVVWPGHIEGGSRSAAFVSSTDWYPTLIEMLGVEKPEGHVFDGVSQVSALLGREKARSSIFCFFPQYSPQTESVPATSVRRDRWKLIRFHHDGDDRRDRFELYDLEADIAESRNLASAHPERVRSLNEEISGYLRDIGALVPIRNPIYQPASDQRDESDQSG